MIIDNPESSQLSPNKRQVVISQVDIHEMRNWLLSAQLCLSEIKQELASNNRELDSLVTVERAIEEVTTILNKH